MTQSLPVKYRPTSFEEVVGHNAILKALEGVLKRNSHTFLFHGPSGTGKTTLARIVAAEVGCLPEYILEVDAATNTGVENIRDIQETLRYLPMGSSKRAVILDEAHMLSKSAWNSLLKVTENPPAHVYWFLCTTEVDKVPATIKTRCSIFGLALLPSDQLKTVVKRVAKAERMKIPDDVLEIIIAEARGSPRQAIANLDLCVECETKKEASEILKSALASDATIALCRFLVGGGGSWASAMEIVGNLKEENPESVRIVLCNYVAAVLKKSKSNKDAGRLLAILEAFEGYYNPSEKLAPLLLSLGRVLLQ